MSDDLINLDVPCCRCLSHLAKWTVGADVKHCQVSKTASVKCEVCRINKKTCFFPYGVLAAAGRELYDYICGGDIDAAELDRLKLMVRKELQRKKDQFNMSAPMRSARLEALEDERQERRLMAFESIAKSLRTVASQLVRIEPVVDSQLAVQRDIAATLKRSLDEPHPVAQAVDSLKSVLEAFAANPAKRVRTGRKGPAARPQLDRDGPDANPDADPGPDENLAGNLFDDT